MIDINNFIQSQLELIEESYKNEENPFMLKGMLFTLTKIIEEADLMEEHFQNYINLENKINNLHAKEVA